MNSHFNSNFLYDKIYEVTFENSVKIYVGLTCVKLDIRLKCHATNETTVSAYKRSSKEEAMTKLTKKQHKLIEELTIDFN